MRKEAKLPSKSRLPGNISLRKVSFVSLFLSLDQHSLAIYAGLIIRERNYLDVYIYDKWQGNHLPDFQIGEQFEPDELELKEGMTSQPNLLTEADLVGLMDKNGIGKSLSLFLEVELR